MLMEAQIKGTGVHKCACMYICIQQNISPQVNVLTHKQIFCSFSILFLHPTPGLQ